MTELELQQHIVTLLEDSLARFSVATATEQKQSHDRFPNPRYTEIQGRLEWLLDLERVLLKRMETVGR